MFHKSNYIENILEKYLDKIEHLDLGSHLKIQTNLENLLHFELRIVPIFNSKYEKTGISIEIHDLGEIYKYLNFLDASIESAKEGNFSNLIPLDKIPEKTYVNLLCTKVNHLLEYFNLFFNDVLMFLENLVEGNFDDFSFEKHEDSISSQSNLAWTGRQDISYVFKHVQKKYKNQHMLFDNLSQNLEQIITNLHSLLHAPASTSCQQVADKLHEFYLAIFGVGMDVEQVTVIIEDTRNKLSQAQDFQATGINVLHHLKEIQSTIEFLTHNIRMGMKDISSGIKHIEQGDIGLGMRLLKADSHRLYKMIDECLVKTYKSFNAIGIESENNSIDVILTNASKKMTEMNLLLDLLTSVLVNVRGILSSETSRFEALEIDIQKNLKSTNRHEELQQSIEDIESLHDEFKIKVLGN